MGIVNNIFEEKFALSSYVPKTSQKNFDTKNDAENDKKFNMKPRLKTPFSRCGVWAISQAV